jgi:hypothetical protein
MTYHDDERASLGERRPARVGLRMRQYRQLHATHTPCAIPDCPRLASRMTGHDRAVCGIHAAKMPLARRQALVRSWQGER